MRRTRLEPSALAILVGAALVALLPVGCGGGRTAAPAPRPTVAGAEPALARAARRPGELVVRGGSSPASHGPYRFRGRYRVRFAQWSPEDPRVDFAQETAFTVSLDARAETEEAGGVRLFGAARPAGERRLRIDGRFYVDVAYGDFPYVVRFEPLR